MVCRTGLCSNNVICVYMDIFAAIYIPKFFYLVNIENKSRTKLNWFTVCPAWLTKIDEPVGKPIDRFTTMLPLFLSSITNLSFWVDRSEQTVQTQIRLLLEIAIRSRSSMFAIHSTNIMPQPISSNYSIHSKVIVCPQI